MISDKCKKQIHLHEVITFRLREFHPRPLALIKKDSHKTVFFSRTKEVFVFLFCIGKTTLTSSLFTITYYPHKSSFFRE